MMYKCLECGHLFDCGEEKSTREYRGECFGFPAYEDVISCPVCGGDFAETKQCKICGSEHLEDELNGGVCEDCIDEYRKNFNACYELSIGETTPIEINSLLASLFDVSDIEQILKEYIRERWQDVSCDKFIDEDKSWFGERLVEEVRKNENSKGES